jgi:hypothetical protein
MNNRGHICVSRWHIADNIPFQRSFEGAIEKYFPNSRPTYYASTAFWYQEPGQADPYARVPLGPRTNYWVEVEPFRVRGAREGEKLAMTTCSGGKTQVQAMDGIGEGWSSDAQLWWTGAKPADRLELAVPVDRRGEYVLKLQMTKAPDYGIVQVWMNGKKVGKPLDLYHPEVRPTGELDFGIVKLKEGEQRLGFEIVGSNPKAIASYMVGLDYLKLEPVVAAPDPPAKK